MQNLFTYYGIAYHYGCHILAIRDLEFYGLNRAIIIETISDTLLTGFYMNDDGEKQYDTFNLVPKVDYSQKIFGEWRLKEFSEVKLDMTYGWGATGVKGLNEKGFRSKIIDLNLKPDHVFSLELDGNQLLEGEWNFSKSGNLILLKTN